MHESYLIPVTAVLSNIEHVAVDAACMHVLLFMIAIRTTCVVLQCIRNTFLLSSIYLKKNQNVGFKFVKYPAFVHKYYFIIGNSTSHFPFFIFSVY